MSWVIITMAIVDMDGSCQFSADSEPKSIGFVWVSIRVISNDLGWPWRPFACCRTSPSLLLNCPVRQRQPWQHGALQILYCIVLYCIVSNAIQRTFMRHFARFLLIRRVARSLGDSWASYVIIIIIIIIITDGKWGLLKYCFLACF